jgi:hypothetical protein
MSMTIPNTISEALEAQAHKAVEAHFRKRFNGGPVDVIEIANSTEGAEDTVDAAIDTYTPDFDRGMTAVAQVSLYGRDALVVAVQDFIELCVEQANELEAA